MAVAGIARHLGRVPGLGERSNLRVAGAVVLLEGKSELGGTRVSNVDVRALVLAEVAARSRHLSVEGVVCIGRGDGKLAAVVSERHALISTVPVAKSIAVRAGKLVNDKSSSSGVAGSGDSSRRIRAGWSGRDNVLGYGVAAVEGHWAE